MSILQILNEVASDNSRLHKEAVLKKNKDCGLLQRVFKAAYDPYINYYQIQIPPYNPEQGFVTRSLSEALDQLQYLADRTFTGSAAKDHLAQILSSCNDESATVIERIIQRDLRVGCSESTANKVWPGIIPTFEVMLAHKDCSGIKYPAIANCKMDGVRCHVYYDGKTAKAVSRNGKEFNLLGALDKSAQELMSQGETWDGELVFFEKGVPMDRKTSNGLANKAIKGTLSEAEAEKVIFTCWDIVDFTSTIPYTKRFSEMCIRFLLRKNKFRIVRWKVVKNADEANDFYLEMIQDGQEGAVLKNINSMWVPKRTKDLGKIKAEEEADLVIVSVEEGKGKYVGMMGALVCETSDGKLRVNVGTGFSDELRKQEWKTGTIVTVRYNQIIKDKTSDTFSLFLPRFVEQRFDKNVANKFGDLK